MASSPSRAPGGGSRWRSAEAGPTLRPGGAQVDGATVIQYVVPVVDTGWLALLTGTTATPALRAGVEEVTDAIAASLRFQSIPTATGASRI